MDQNTGTSFGSTLAIIVIILVIAAGGYYVWKNYLGSQKTAPLGSTEINISDLEANLGAIDVGATSELDDMEKQF